MTETDNQRGEVCNSSGWRPEWWPRHSIHLVEQPYSVLLLAQELHSDTVGSFEQNPEWIEQAERCLRWVFDNWQPSSSSYFDQAVKTLIHTALTERWQRDHCD